MSMFSVSVAPRTRGAPENTINTTDYFICSTAQRRRRRAGCLVI